MKKKNGFTLIELLAVIIILGILMIIAIPSVTSYINNSRKSAYVNTAKEIIAGARNLVNEGKLEMFDTGTTYYIPVSCVSTENGQKSPYGDFVEDQAFVVVTYTGNNYNYFWISRDTTGQGVKTITPVGELDEDDIISDITSSDITPTEPAEAGKTTIKVLSKDDCKTYGSSNSTNSNLVSLIANVGDYITLVPNSNSYIISTDLSGWSESQTITPNELTLWRIIKKYDDGRVDAVSEYVSSVDVGFSKVVGFANYVDSMQTIAQQYAKEGYTNSVRMMGYNGQTLIISNKSAFDGSSSTAPSTTSTPTNNLETGSEISNGVLGDTLFINDLNLVGDVYKTDTTTYGSTGLKAYKVNNTSSSSFYRLCSRRYLYSSFGTPSYAFGSFLVDGNGSYTSTYDEHRAYRNSSWVNGSIDYGEKFPLRPIITLNNNVSINSGTGEKNNPYILD